MEYFIQQTEKEEFAYKSSLIGNSLSMRVLGNKLAVNILKELGKEPSCALDLARKLKIHEQKVYYHIRGLEKAGLIKLLRTEERTGGTAKIYNVLSPVVSVKLYDAEPIHTFKSVASKVDLFQPFIKQGKLNAKIVVGSSYPHGKYDATARDVCFAIDLAFFLGNLVNELTLPTFIIDTEVRKEDLMGNLILIGGAKVNVVSEKMNKYFPIYFDADREWAIVSSITKKVYTYDNDCVVLRMKNPFNKEAEIILLAGKRSSGTRSGVIALTQHFNEIMKEKITEDKNISRMVTGLDKNGDGVIDSIEFLE